MKTAALFMNPEADLARVQTRLLSLLHCGNWQILLPDRPQPAECQIVATCLQLKRQFTAVGTTARSQCGAPGRHYQRLSRLSRLWEETEWSRDDHLIRQADMVVCLDMPEIEARVPLMKRNDWVAALRLDVPGAGQTGYQTAIRYGLGRLLVETLSVP